jgi:hypothetical protein
MAVFVNLFLLTMTIDESPIKFSQKNVENRIVFKKVMCIVLVAS